MPKYRILDAKDQIKCEWRQSKFTFCKQAFKWDWVPEMHWENRQDQKVQ